MDGKNILQAEFEHAREENGKDDAESVNADGINWGVWARVSRLHKNDVLTIDLDRLLGRCHERL
jgi:hypothetical protein